MIVTEGLCLNNVIQIRTHQRRNQISEKGTQRPIISFNIYVLHYTRYLTMKIFDIRQTPEGQQNLCLVSRSPLNCFKKCHIDLFYWYIEHVKMDIIQFFFSILSRKYIFQLQVRNICTKMNYLDIFNHVIQFTIYQHFTYQIILLMRKINLHIIKLIKSCGSCEHIQKSNYLKKKLICHCKYNCQCFITIMDNIQSKWARRAIKPVS